MPTPSIQTLRTDAQQVLNLDSISAVRSVVAATLANANAGTPLNPNLTTQQLWNEFYQIVTQPKSDIESIIANQLMKFMYAPPAPGGVGADGQVIFNDGGVLAGDPQFLWNKTTNLLTVTGSATITGDLTVDTNVLKVDTLNNRVGIGTASPADFLEVVGSGANGIRVSRSGLPTQFATLSAGATGPTLNASSAIGELTFGIAGTAATAMTLNSTGLGIGTAPTYKIDVSATTNLARLNSATGNDCNLVLGQSGIGNWVIYNAATNGQLRLQFGGNDRVFFDGTGNVGIGVTPSAWATLRGLQNGRANIVGYVSNAEGAWLTNNAFYDGSWKYQTSAQASHYQQLSGVHSWSIAGTGTAGNAITFTQAMTLDASGNLLVGTTTANGRVAVDADLAVYNGMSVKNTGTTYGASSFFFRFINSSGATAGSIQHTAVTTTNYSTTSDARLKESKGISNDTSVIDNTVVHDFIWKADGSTDRGVFAQEAHAVKPRAVSVGSDELTEDGNIKTPWSVDYSKFVPDLIVYCQQLKKQVVELTARVQTLEAK
jgi:hypothetical protein